MEAEECHDLAERAVDALRGMLPDSWSHHLTSSHQIAASAPQEIQDVVTCHFDQLFIAGSKKDTVYAGIENNSLASIRAQILGTRLLVCVSAIDVAANAGTTDLQAMLQYLQNLGADNLPDVINMPTLAVGIVKPGDVMYMPTGWLVVDKSVNDVVVGVRCNALVVPDTDERDGLSLIMSQCDSGSKPPVKAALLAWPCAVSADEVLLDPTHAEAAEVDSITVPAAAVTVAPAAPGPAPARAPQAPAPAAAAAAAAPGPGPGPALNPEGPEELEGLDLEEAFAQVKFEPRERPVLATPMVVDLLSQSQPDEDKVEAVEADEEMLSPEPCPLRRRSLPAVNSKAQAAEEAQAAQEAQAAPPAPAHCAVAKSKSFLDPCPAPCPPNPVAVAEASAATLPDETAGGEVQAEGSNGLARFFQPSGTQPAKRKAPAPAADSKEKPPATTKKGRGSGEGGGGRGRGGCGTQGAGSGRSAGRGRGSKK